MSNLMFWPQAAAQQQLVQERQMRTEAERQIADMRGFSTPQNEYYDVEAGGADTRGYVVMQLWQRAISQSAFRSERFGIECRAQSQRSIRFLNTTRM